MSGADSVEFLGAHREEGIDPSHERLQLSDLEAEEASMVLGASYHRSGQ